MGKISTPVLVIINRLKRDGRTGRRLDGLKFFEFPIRAIKEDKDVPYAVLDVPRTSENERKLAGRSNSYGTDQIRFSINLVVSTKAGTVNENGTGLLNWAERIQDALTTDDTGAADAYLDRSVSQPVSTNLSEGVAHDTTLEITITGVLVSKPFTVNQRT